MESGCKVTPKPNSVKEFFTSWYFWKPFLGIAAGILGGFLYFCFVESKTVPCLFTNDTYSTMFFGGFLGYFVTGSPCFRLGR
jgi:hypothetical protein